MSFQVKVRRINLPNTGGEIYTTTPDLGEPATQQQILTQMQARSAFTEGDIINVITTLFDVLLEEGAQTRGTEVLFDSFRIGVSSGGNFSDPETPLSVELIRPTLNIYLAAPLQKRFRNGLTLERTGIESARAPLISLVRDDRTNEIDQYTAGDVLRINGRNLKPNTANAQEGVFLTPEAGGTEVRVTRYIETSDENLAVLIPTGLTGGQRLTVRVQFGAVLRSTTHQEVLTPA